MDGKMMEEACDKVKIHFWLGWSRKVKYQPSGYGCLTASRYPGPGHCMVGLFLSRVTRYVSRLIFTL
jgi:hypothetical protein